MCDPCRLSRRALQAQRRADAEKELRDAERVWLATTKGEVSSIPPNTPAEPVNEGAPSDPHTFPGDSQAILEQVNSPLQEQDSHGSIGSSAIMAMQSHVDDAPAPTFDHEAGVPQPPAPAPAPPPAVPVRSLPIWMLLLDVSHSFTGQRIS